MTEIARMQYDTVELCLLVWIQLISIVQTTALRQVDLLTNIQLSIMSRSAI